MANILGVYWGNIGIMEKKMETTTVYWAYIGAIRKSAKLEVPTSSGFLDSQARSAQTPRAVVDTAALVSSWCATWVGASTGGLAPIFRICMVTSGHHWDG